MCLLKWFSGCGWGSRSDTEKVKLIFWLVLGFSGLDEVFTFQCGSR